MLNAAWLFRVTITTSQRLKRLMNGLGGKCISRGVPVVIGMGMAWVVVRIVKNEARLLLRRQELQDALTTTSLKEKRRLLYGKEF